MPDFSQSQNIGEPTTYQTLDKDYFVFYNSDTTGSIDSQGFYFCDANGQNEQAFQQAMQYKRKMLGLFLPKGWKVKSFRSSSTIYLTPLVNRESSVHQIIKY